MKSELAEARAYVYRTLLITFVYGFIAGAGIVCVIWFLRR
jgi:hypothetical protein